LLPVVAACRACRARWEGPELPVACPECGGVDIELIGGDELVLESIEYRA
jgi:Zn finger protein HypA/HybF involved in hydrogenase expression